MKKKLSDVNRKNLKKLNEKYENNPKGLKSDYRLVANTRHLTRIIIFLNDNPGSLKSQICEGTGIKVYLGDALHWLVNNKVVVKCLNNNRKSSINYYKLNPLFNRYE